MIEGPFLLTLISIFLLLLISAFFSASETSLTAVSRAKIHRLMGEGNKRAARVSKIRDNKDSLIGTILLGNNAVNITASAMATAFAIHYFGEEDGVVYASVAMTFLVLVFGEIMPKTYAFRHTQKVALFVSPICDLLIKVFSPVTRTLQLLVNGIMALFGLKASSEEDIMTTEALRGTIELHHDAGMMVKDDKDMLDSILDLSETEVGEIMVHRRQMESIEIDQSAEEIIDQVLESTHTRIPFWRGEKENIIGVLHTKDFLRALQRHGRNLSLEDIRNMLIEPWFVPETTTLQNQLHAFRKSKKHFALVVDEYGVLQGVVSLIDILEEIVGKFGDDTDEKPIVNIIKEADGSYVVEGTTTVRDINRELDWDLPDDEAVTVAGLIIHEAQNIPDIKQTFHFHGCRFEILGKKRNQITKVRISKIHDQEEVTQGY